MHRCCRRMVQCHLTGDGNVSFHKGTLAPPVEYDWTCASFGPLESTTETGNGSVQPFLHSLQQEVSILYNGRPSTRIAPSHGDLDLPCNAWCFRPMRVHNPNGTSIGSVVFAQMTAECLYTLQWFACFSLKIAPSHVGIWTSCNTWFIGRTWVRNANGNFVSAVFAGLTSVTERQTDRQTMLLGAMRCNNAWDTAKPQSCFMLVRTFLPLLSRYLYVQNM